MISELYFDSWKSTSTGDSLFEYFLDPGKLLNERSNVFSTLFQYKRIYLAWIGEKFKIIPKILSIFLEKVSIRKNSKNKKSTNMAPWPIINENCISIDLDRICAKV